MAAVRIFGVRTLKKPGSDGGEYVDNCLLDLSPRSSVDRRRFGETYRKYLQCSITKEDGLYFSHEDGGVGSFEALVCVHTLQNTRRHISENNNVQSFRLFSSPRL